MKKKNFYNKEILSIINTIAIEKEISKDSIIEIIEESIAFSAKRKYSSNVKIKASIDKRLGNIQLYREILVVDNNNKKNQNAAIQNNKTINLIEARKKNPNLKKGDLIKEILPPLEIDRLNAVSVKQIMINKIYQLERNKILKEYKNKVGEIVTGTIEKIESKGYIIKLGNTNTILKKEQILKNDYYKSGDKIKAYLVKLNKESSGPLIILSRTHKKFVEQLFAQEIPEIYDKIIQIKSIARDPGLRTKIAVYSSDLSIDPVGSCVGIRGIRVQAIIKELKGEKIDIVKWSENIATLLVNSFGSIKLFKLIIDEERRKVQIIVSENDQSQAIGKKGQNIKLISELVGWQSNISTEKIETTKRQEELIKTSKLFIEILNLEEILAKLIISKGFTSIENLSEADVKSLSSIEGLDEEIATELISRAKEHLNKQKKTSIKKITNQ